MRRFEHGVRHWSIQISRSGVDLVWGEPGRPEQRHHRAFGSDQLAAQFVEEQIAKQRAAGFVEVVPEVRYAATAGDPPAPSEPALPEEPVSRTIRFEIAAEERTSYRRYPKPARFMELVQRDRVLMEWNGELEHPGDVEKSPRRETTFASIADASEAYDDLVQSAREDRWKQVRDTKALALVENPELEAQCWAAADDDPVPWSVYADWLLEQDEALGSLATISSNTAADIMISRQLEDIGGYPELTDVSRRHGFPRAATIKVRDLDEADPATIAEAARAVRASSFGRFVDVLRFGLAGYTDKNDWAPVLRALAEAPHPERIRELYFNDYEYTDCEISWVPMGNLDGLLAPFTGLEVLHLKSGAGGVLGELALPNLRTLIRESGGLAASEIESIVNARCPKLAHLEIWFGSSDYGADSTVGSIRPILDGKLPALRHLGIVNCEWVEDAIEALATSRVLPRLHSLDLSCGVLAVRGVELLRQHAPLFRHLASIDLSRNLLLPDECEQIRGVLDNVILVDQRERDDYYEEDEADGEVARYVAVGE